MKQLLSNVSRLELAMIFEDLRPEVKALTEPITEDFYQKADEIIRTDEALSSYYIEVRRNGLSADVSINLPFEGNLNNLESLLAPDFIPNELKSEVKTLTNEIDKKKLQANLYQQMDISTRKDGVVNNLTSIEAEAASCFYHIKRELERLYRKYANDIILKTAGHFAVIDGVINSRDYDYLVYDPVHYRLYSLIPAMEYQKGEEISAELEVVLYDAVRTADNRRVVSAILRNKELLTHYPSVRYALYQNRETDLIPQADGSLRSCKLIDENVLDYLSSFHEPENKQHKAHKLSFLHSLSRKHIVKKSQNIDL